MPSSTSPLPSSSLPSTPRSPTISQQTGPPLPMILTPRRRRTQAFTRGDLPGPSHYTHTSPGSIQTDTPLSTPRSSATSTAPPSSVMAPHPHWGDLQYRYYLVHTALWRTPSSASVPSTTTTSSSSSSPRRTSRKIHQAGDIPVGDTTCSFFQAQEWDDWTEVSRAKGLRKFLAPEDS